MNPSYFRIELPKAEALPRFARWLGVPEVGPLVETKSTDAVRRAVRPNGTWRVPALFISELDGWTLFSDLSGAYSSTASAAWLEFAGQNNFVFAGYNDAIGYAELIVIEDGKVTREFTYDKEDPSSSINRGVLVSESETPITDWIGVASFVDDDDLAFSDEGVLWAGSV